MHQKLLQFAGTSEGEFVDWLRQVLDRNLLDAVRHATAQKRSVSREVSPISDMPGSSEPSYRTLTPDERALRNEEFDRLERALGTLLPDQQLVVRMVHLEGNSLAQASAQTNRSSAAVAKLLQRGIKNLRAVLAEVS